MAYPADAGTITPLADGTDYMEDDNVNNVVTELEAAKTLIGVPGVAQSHLATLLDTLADNYVGGRCYGESGTTDEVYVGAFAGIISNVAGSVRKNRVKSSVTTLTAADLDTGSMAVGYYYIYATADAAASTPVFKFSASASAPTGYTNYKRIGWFYNETASVLDVTNLFVSSFTGGGNRNIIIIKDNTFATAALTGITLISNDNSLPQNTEGFESIVGRIIPTLTTSKIRITGRANVSCSIGIDQATAAVFKNAGADAIYTSPNFETDAGPIPLPLDYEEAPGAIDPILYSVRVGGPNVGTYAVNGNNGANAALYGGSFYTLLQIEEVLL